MRTRIRAIFRALPTRRRRGFTLTELLVAIGIVAVLTVGIGQIFQSISGIVNVGTASAGIDQIARAFERQLRDDIEALNNTPADETFIVIRMREVGDINRDGNVDEDDGEVALYLSEQDRQFDIQAGLAPYEEGSRAVTRRLDELAFIARGFSDGGVFSSFQLDQLKGDNDPEEQPPRPTFSAPHARIYYGHALRPVPDPTWPPENPETSPRLGPDRVFIPDGDFGQPVGATNRWIDEGAQPSTGIPPTVTGLNTFAADWILARQALLLPGEGGGVVGERNQNVSPIGNGREFVPYIRDMQTYQRWPDVFEQIDQVVNEVDVADFLFQEDFPEARALSWGRTDIAAQSREDVQRWLEGADVDWNPGSTLPSDGFAYSDGLPADPSETRQSADDFDKINGPLWQRTDNNVGPLSAQQFNEFQLRSALAGTMTRLLAVSDPPEIKRGPRLGQSLDSQRQNIQPTDAVMDLHAAIASRCSNFEIAWSDGATALRDIDIDGDDEPDVRAGDLIWFDISVLDEDDANRSRSSWRFWKQERPSSDVNFVNSANFGEGAYLPEVNFFDRSVSDTRFRPSRLILHDANGTFANIPEDRAWQYSVIETRGAPLDGGQPVEYLAIWPFRRPDSEGEYTASIPKDILLRIRMTLQDPQGRIPGGKDFEFIYRINPSAD